MNTQLGNVVDLLVAIARGRPGGNIQKSLPVPAPFLAQTHTFSFVFQISEPNDDDSESARILVCPRYFASLITCRHSVVPVVSALFSLPACLAFQGAALCVQHHSLAGFWDVTGVARTRPGNGAKHAGLFSLLNSIIGRESDCCITQLSRRALLVPLLQSYPNLVLPLAFSFMNNLEESQVHSPDSLFAFFKNFLQVHPINLT